MCVCVCLCMCRISKQAKTKLLLLFILGLFMNDLCILVCLHSCHKLMCQKFALALHGISTIWRTVFSSSCNANSLGFEGFTWIPNNLPVWGLINKEIKLRNPKKGRFLKVRVMLTSMPSYSWVQLPGYIHSQRSRLTMGNASAAPQTVNPKSWPSSAKPSQDCYEDVCVFAGNLNYYRAPVDRLMWPGMTCLYCVTGYSPT